MSTPLLKDLDDLVSKNIISADTARQIEIYYSSRKESLPNRFTVAMSILGALLLSSGVILVIAHNWDNLARPLKTIIAFLPLAIGQALCAYALFKMKDRAWKECSAIVLFFGVATSISLIAQIYQVGGSLPSFLLTWMALTLPLVYIMRSSVISLLIIALATWHGALTGYSYSKIPYEYVVIMLLLIPHYYDYLKNHTSSNFFHLQNWFIATSLLIILGAFAVDINSARLIIIAYMTLAGIFYMIGNSELMKNTRLFANPFTLTGVPTILTILLAWTFKWAWQPSTISGGDSLWAFNHPFFYIVIGLLLVCGYLFAMLFRKSSEIAFDIVAITPFVFAATVTIFFKQPLIGMLILNIWILAIGIFFIRKGAHKDHLGILNFGLLVIATLAVIRFFDSDIPFIWRGVVFILTGAGFFISNYIILRRRRIAAKNRTA